MRNKFTICVLLYGDYPTLADRCLRSITNTVSEADLNLRVGLNAVSPTVRDWVHAWVPEENITESSTNIFKYPMMRKMFYEKPIDTEYVMWMDDDSYLTGYGIEDNLENKWLQEVEYAMVGVDMLGAVYNIDWQGQQKEFVKSQPWYMGHDPGSRKRVKFITGGWWNIRTAVLYKHDYPWDSLEHIGGDTMLGELCFQQKYRLRNFRKGVRINANEAGQESKAVRRGRGFDRAPLGCSVSPVAAVKNAALKKE